MLFNTRETQLLLVVLNYILNEKKNVSESIVLIFEKLNQNEYVKGKLLNVLYNELKKTSFDLEDERNIEFQNILQRIKFKATPR